MLLLLPMVAVVAAGRLIVLLDSLSLLLKPLLPKVGVEALASTAHNDSLPLGLP